MRSRFYRLFFILKFITLVSLIMLYIPFVFQLGDLETAQSYFKHVESKATGDPNSLSSVVMNK